MSIDNMTAVELPAREQTTAVSGALVTGGWMSERSSQILLKRAIAKARRQGLNPSTGRARARTPVTGD